jgi:Protein of unknown function (DUF1501)
MLTVYGRGERYCDGVSRRSFLRIGGLGLGAGALTLADLNRLEAATGTSARHKAVINVFLGGGPPHQDLFDLKTEAPVEIRGEFVPIDTVVPGVRICEMLPGIAKVMDRCAIIRSVVGATDRHDAFQCMTGWLTKDLASLGGRPSLGSVVSRLQGPVDPSVPPFVGLAEPTKEIRWSDSGKPGFLGPSYAPFKPDGEGRNNMTLSGTTLDQLQDRQRLLASLDKLRRDMHTSGQIAAMDRFTQGAFDVLTSSRLADALDLSKEDPRTRERYGNGQPYNYQFDGAPTVNEHLLLARRLVEAGVRVVTLSYGRWDSHSRNFALVRDHGSKLDQCLSALIEDLDERGMLDDVTVIAWGEFGRTPRINKNAGRDHWPGVSCALLAGGGMRTGQVIGATNRLGEEPRERPVHFQEIFATLYRNLGLDSSRTTITDPAGRPQYLVERPAIPELV